MVDGQLYCTATFGTASDWYHNVMAEPRVEVWTSHGVGQWWRHLRLQPELAAQPARRGSSADDNATASADAALDAGKDGVDRDADQQDHDHQGDHV